jgi:hypothetical protein
MVMKNSSRHSQATEDNEDLAKYVNFYPRASSKRKKHWKTLRTEMTNFHRVTRDIFSASLEVTETTAKNASLLREDEVGFIQRAHLLCCSSSSLFKLLMNSIGCKDAHVGMVHLSGFMDSITSHAFNFEVLISACGAHNQRSWTSTRCRRSVSSHLCALPDKC